VELLFASNYVDNGSTHVLGFTHRRPAWSGVVVAYQPAEYQPNALDDLAGNNFQILANAIYYAAYGAVTGVPARAGGDVVLGQNYPNPFNPSTAIDFELSQPEQVSLVVFDVNGALVRRLVSGAFAAGIHHATWDGRRQDGAAVASGVYFYRLTAGSYIGTRRMLLVK
jgi:hypothetical protein